MRSIMFHYIAITVLVLFVSVPVMAANEMPGSDEEKPESSRFGITLSIGLGITDSFLSYSHKNELFSDAEAYEAMDQGMGLRLYGSIGYRGFGASYSGKINTSSSDGSEFGTSEIIDFTMVYFSEKYAILAMYKDVKGYGYREDGAVAQYWDDDLKIRSIGARFMYAFNDDFSLKAVYRCIGKQKDDGGSFYLTGRVFYYGYDNHGEPIFPGLFQAKVSNSDERNVSRINSINFLPTAGYAYNWQWTNFAIHMSADLGVGYQYYWYKVAGGGEGSGHNVLAPFYSNGFYLDAGMTYNRESFYLLTSVMLEGVGVKLNEVILFNYDFIVHYEAGIRF